MRWRVEAIAGKITTLFINEQSYALEQGSLFLIRATPGSTQVVQHKHNLAGRCSNYEHCENLLKSEPVIMQFIRATLQAHYIPKI
jgi:hypothetical protein